MRLYLSSSGLGNQPTRLAELVADNRRAAVILNAYDYATETRRQQRLDQELAALDALGLQATELDLRHYFTSSAAHPDLARVLARFGLVWVRGGNTFVLRRALQASGFDRCLHKLLSHDRLVYGGFSAAIAVLSPSLRGLELVDDPHTVPPGYPASILWDGLGLIPYAFAPHYRSDHPESAAVDRLVQYYIDHHILFRALRDGEVLVVTGIQEDIIA